MIIPLMHTFSPSGASNPWMTRIISLLLAAFATASVGYWVLKWPAPSRPAQAAAQEPSAPPINVGQVAQLLGKNPATATNAAADAGITPSASYKLIGVIAVGHRDGSALIGVEGKPAKPFRVGEHVSDDLVLQAVNARSVSLSASMKDPAAMTLELPPVQGSP
jgi:general secretion pathway protein C